LAGETRPVPEKPNVVLIMADDLGRDWLGSYGSEENVTPNLDKLAATGLRFETCYSTAICTPTRHMLLTGRYPFRSGWTVHHDAPRWGGQFFDPEREITFARALKKAGYATALMGKWQVNDLRVDRDVLARHGFDEHCVWTGYETGNPPSYVRYWDGYLQINGRRPDPTGTFGPDVCTDFAIDFIRRNKDRPFLAYYGMILVHGPHKTTPHNKDGKGTYKGQVEYLDHLVGRIVASLDELGIRDRTIVIFTTDNGSSQGARAWGAQQPKGKGKVAERGVHVPFIVNCPGLVPGGKTTDRLIDLSDVLPTLADLAGAPLPDGVALDGRSFASELLGAEGGPRPREWIFSQVGSRRVIRDKRFTLYNDGRFYDVAADPGETSDLSGSSEPAVAAARRRLTEILDSFPPDTPLPAFPPRYAEIKKVPSLPPGSGRWQPWTPRAKPEKGKKRGKR
jgi:arylsulfatase A-like enzyme